MYRIENENAAIREVQKLLYGISYSDSGSYLPKVGIDGIYGEETMEAVRIFQSRYQLTPTGTVNYETWNLLYLKYSEVEENK